MYRQPVAEGSHQHCVWKLLGSRQLLQPSADLNQACLLYGGVQLFLNERIQISTPIRQW